MNQIGEKKNDDALAKKMAALCDVFVMDAFGTAHRAQASTHGVAKYAPIACAGPLLKQELDSLEQALAEFGEALLNTRSTTWRGLAEQERAAPPLDLIKAHPALMKRPLIVSGDKMYLGWTKDVQAALGAT